MGMNYYLAKCAPTYFDPYHIGKSSYGWMFCFQSQNNPFDDPPVVWNTFEQVKSVLKRLTVDSKDYAIINEEDEVVSYDDFVAMVERKQKEDAANPENFHYSRNVDGYRFMDGYFC